MKSMGMKFVAILLAALCLLTAVCSVLGMLYLTAYDLYDQTPQQAEAAYLERASYSLAYNAALDFAAVYLGNMQEDEMHLLGHSSTPELVSLALTDTIVYPATKESETRVEQLDTVWTVTHVVSVEFPMVWTDGEQPPETDMVPLYEESLRVWRGHEKVTYHLAYYDSGPLEVTLALEPIHNPWQNVAEGVYALRYVLPAITAGSLLLLAVCLVFLCWAAGRKPKVEEIRPGGLNRLPLDLYALIDCIIGYYGLMILHEGVTAMVYSDLSWLSLLVAVGVGMVLCLVIVGFVFCFAAQVKVKSFWWRHSVIGFCLLMIFRGIRFCVRGLRAIFRLLPVIWQWLLTAALMVLAAAITGAFAFFDNSYIRVDEGACFLFFLTVLACVGVVLYGGYCFGTILKGAKEMAAGNLDHKVNTRLLLGAFKDCGENLNFLSSAAMVAAQQQMKSERMKTELIANVSHDIKTPLTSIINYVDLLQQPHSQEEGAQYLEVLARQSQRLKKLTEDLVEMSKASTGNVTVELTELDAGETVLQALGEFGDKLDSVPLSIVFRQPEEPVMIRADGRLTWRVMSNILSNAVKYAQPGTRLYVDIGRVSGQVTVAFKNISREPLNLSAEELMERFVRGDASRNTEGSGLGLNIAKSLMQVQHGDLALHIDGDLFKVTIVFPTWE